MEPYQTPVAKLMGDVVTGGPFWLLMMLDRNYEWPGRRHLTAGFAGAALIAVAWKILPYEWDPVVRVTASIVLACIFALAHIALLILFLVALAWFDHWARWRRRRSQTEKDAYFASRP